MFYSVTFWRSVCFFSFKLMVILVLFFVWALLNQFTNATIAMLDAFINAVFVIVIASLLIVYLLTFIKRNLKRKKKWPLWPLFLVNFFSVVLVLLVALFSTLL